MHEVLKELIRPETQFCDIQEASLAAIILGAGLVVIVMGTSRGKSVLFMLLAMCLAIVVW